MIVNWVNRFRVAGPDALRPRKKGRKKTLNTSDDNTQNKPVEESSVDTSAEHVKELEEELLKLRIENAFLKELMILAVLSFLLRPLNAVSSVLLKTLRICTDPQKLDLKI